MRKVIISQRSVYYKYAEVEVEIPEGVECNNIQEHLIENEHLYQDEIDKAIDKSEYEFGFGIDECSGMNEQDSESEWRFDVVGENYGGHL
tara:strand:- start:317 stop:586 length:270 start_codon:yes stop_codon:yes gene_type:complete